MMKRIVTLAAVFVFFIMLLSSCKTNQGPLAATNFDGLNGPVLIDGSVNNWKPDPFSIYSNETLTLNTNPAYVEEGSGSVQIYCNPLNGTEPISMYKAFNQDTNLSNRIVSIWMYTSPTSPTLAALNGTYFLNLYALVDGGSYKEISSSNQFSTGWTQIKFTVPNSDDYTYISAMKFSLEAIANSTPPSFTGYIYFDEISW
jgi:hypothetical protein